MTALEVLVGVATAGVIAAVVGEVAWLRFGLGLRAGPGAGRVGPLRTVTLMVLGATPAAMLMARIDARLWPLLGSLSPDALRSFWHGHPILAAVAAFVAWDAAGYGYHRLGHRTAIGWAAHRVHHSGTNYDLTLAWRQSWFPVHALVAFPPVALVGFDLRTVLGCAAVSKLWQALVHTSLPVRPPHLLAAVVMTPTTHRRHHTPEGGASNLGPVLTIWDRLAGTWDPAPVPDDAPIGLRDEPPESHLERLSDPQPDRQPLRRPDQGAVRIETEGWVELARRVRRICPVPSVTVTSRSSRTTESTRPGAPDGLRLVHLVDATQCPETPTRRSTRLPAGPKARSGFGHDDPSAPARADQFRFHSGTVHHRSTAR